MTGETTLLSNEASTADIRPLRSKADCSLESLSAAEKVFARLFGAKVLLPYSPGGTRDARAKDDWVCSAANKSSSSLPAERERNRAVSNISGAWKPSPDARLISAENGKRTAALT